MRQVTANIVNLPNGYDKQETIPERHEWVKIRGEDDRDEDEGKAAAGALAKITSANYQRYKKVFDEKQGNNCRHNALVNLDNEIMLRGAGVAQNWGLVRDLNPGPLNSSKETTEAVPEIQGGKGYRTRC